MTEQEYITTNNLARIRDVSNIMRDIMPGDDYGVDKGLYRIICDSAAKLGENASKKIKIDEGEK